MYGLVIADLFLGFFVFLKVLMTLCLCPSPLSPGQLSWRPIRVLLLRADETPSDQVDVIVLLAAVDGFSSLGAEMIINPVRH